MPAKLNRQYCPEGAFRSSKVTKAISCQRYPRLLSSLTLMLFITACSTVQAPKLDSGGSESITAAPSLERNQRAGSRSQARSDSYEEHGDIVITDVWTRLQAGWQFSEDIDNDRVNQEIAKYLKRPGYFRIVSGRARPYLYEIIEIIDRRGLPTELALLPFIESTYNPNAAAPPDTVGLWQIMGSTGRSLGLKQDWWYDGRRDPIASTEAALDYLEELYSQFDENWPLALAAYNTGPGNVRRAINRANRNSQGTDYWSLELPRITREYVPKLIALSRIISEREAFEIAVVDIPNEPVVSAVEVGSQIDLALAAELSGVEPELLFQLNAGYLQWATHPDQPNHLLLPTEHVEKFNAALLSLDENSRVTWDRYLVRSGDSLSVIARRFNTQVSALQRANNINGSRIIAGESLLIPRAYQAGMPLQLPNTPIYSGGGTNTKTQPNRPVRYTVRSGDSLWSIARRFDLKSSDLAQWNDIGLDSVLSLGQELHLLADPTLAQLESTQDQDNTSLYSVRSGDTLGRIAKRLEVSLEELLDWNDINEDALIHPGQTLMIVQAAN